MLAYVRIKIYEAKADTHPSSPTNNCPETARTDSDTVAETYHSPHKAKNPFSNDYEVNDDDITTRNKSDSAQGKVVTEDQASPTTPATQKVTPPAPATSTPNKTIFDFVSPFDMLPKPQASPVPSSTAAAATSPIFSNSGKASKPKAPSQNPPLSSTAQQKNANSDKVNVPSAAAQKSDNTSQAEGGVPSFTKDLRDAERASVAGIDRSSKTGKAIFDASKLWLVGRVVAGGKGDG